MESPVVVDKPPEYHGRAAKNNQVFCQLYIQYVPKTWNKLCELKLIYCGQITICLCL